MLIVQEGPRVTPIRLARCGALWVVARCGRCGLPLTMALMRRPMVLEGWHPLIEW
jgi:hypothetical protein